MSLLIAAGLFLIAYPDTRSTAIAIVDPTASTFTLISIIALLLLSVSYLIRFCRKRRLAQYAWPIMDELSTSIRTIGSGFVLYPTFAFIVLAGVGIGGCMLMAQILSLGEVKQICECPKNALSNCKCTQIFEFDPAARWYAAVTLLGMIWNLNIILELTRCTAAGTLSLWFFTDEEENGERLLPVFPTYKVFSRMLSKHLGTIAYIAFIRPIYAIQKPIINCIDSRRRKPTTTEFKRSKCVVASKLPYFSVSFSNAFHRYL